MGGLNLTLLWMLKVPVSIMVKSDMHFKNISLKSLIISGENFGKFSWNFSIFYTTQNLHLV